MKKKQLFLILLTISNASFAAVGCITNAYDRYKERYYQKLDSSIRASIDVLRDENVKQEHLGAWKPQACSCPCEQYRGHYLRNTTDAEGYCVVCHHRGSSSRTSIQNKESDAKEIEHEFALFNAINNH